MTLGGDSSWPWTGPSLGAEQSQLWSKSSWGSPLLQNHQGDTTGVCTNTGSVIALVTAKAGLGTGKGCRKEPREQPRVPWEPKAQDCCYLFTPSVG